MQLGSQTSPPSSSTSSSLFASLADEINGSEVTSVDESAWGVDFEYGDGEMDLMDVHADADDWGAFEGASTVEASKPVSTKVNGRTSAARNGGLGTRKSAGASIPGGEVTVLALCQ